MNGRPYRPHGPIQPMAEAARVDRWARWLPLWLALAAFVGFGLFVGVASLRAAPQAAERRVSP